MIKNVITFLCAIYVGLVLAFVAIFLANEVTCYFKDILSLDGNSWLGFLEILAIFICCSFIAVAPMIYTIRRIAEQGK